MKLAITSTPSQARFAPILHRGDPAAAFALAAECGYDGVELHLRRPSDVDSAAVRRLMRETGLVVPTLGTGMAAGEDGLTFASDDPQIRRQAVARIGEHINLAAELGAKVTIGLIWGRVGRDDSGRAGRVAVATACLRQCCRMAAEQGVVLLFEALNRYESDYPLLVAEALAIMDQVGDPRLQFLADTYHMNIEEADIAASLRLAGGRLGHVHLIDSNRQAPGHGHVDIRSVIDALRSINYDGFLSLEVLPLPAPRQAAEDGYRTVKPLLGG